MQAIFDLMQSENIMPHAICKIENVFFVYKMQNEKLQKQNAKIKTPNLECIEKLGNAHIQCMWAVSELLWEIAKRAIFVRKR